MIKYSFIYHTLLTITATDNFVYDFLSYHCLETWLGYVHNWKKKYVVCIY